MATESATDVSRLPRPGLPERIPDLKGRGLLLFQLFWASALLLAIVGPLAGIWYRFDQSGQNSALIVGSRAGVAPSLSVGRIRDCRHGEKREAQKGGEGMVACHGAMLLQPS